MSVRTVLVERLAGVLGIRDGAGFAVGAMPFASFPTCTAAREGEQRRSKGSGATPSHHYECEWDGAAWGWTQITPGSGGLSGLTSTAAEIDDAVDTLGLSGASLITSLDALYVWRDDYNAQGDILAATSPGFYTSVPVGTDGQVLTADSAELSGVRWGASAAGSEVVTTTRAMPIVVNNYIDIGTFTITTGTHNLVLALTVDESSFSVAKQYVLTTQYDETAGVWKVVRPLSDSGPYSTASNFELLAKQSFTVLSLRIRRTLGTVIGTATVRIWNQGLTDAFTTSSATGTDATAYTELVTGGSDYLAAVSSGGGSSLSDILLLGGM